MSKRKHRMLDLAAVGGALSLFAVLPGCWAMTPTARRQFLRDAALGAVGTTLALVAAGSG